MESTFRGAENIHVFGRKRPKTVSDHAAQGIVTQQFVAQAQHAQRSYAFSAG
jgi:hypothetical protein